MTHTDESQIWHEKVYRGQTPEVRGPEVVRWTTKGYFLRRWLRPTPADRVLDVGCGLGEYSLLIALDAREVLGLDASSTAVDAGRCAAEKLGVDNVEFVAGDAYQTADLAGDHAPFDLAICFDLLEHLTDPAPVLGQIRELLRPGGRALIYTNSYGKCSWPYIKEVRRTGGKVGPLWESDERDHHFVRFTDRQLAELTADWRACRVYKNHFLIPAASWLSAQLDKLSPKGHAPSADAASPAASDAPVCRLQTDMRLPRKVVQGAKLAVSVLEMETLGRLVAGAGVYLLLEKP